MKIIQLTDTHLFANDTSELFGVKTNLKFRNIIEKILVKDIVDTDIFILTGDISQDESEQSYQIIAESLSKLNIPVYWIPGNHDDVTQMESVFNKYKDFVRTRQLSFPDWNLIFINTKLNNADEGYLTKYELKILQKELQLASHKKIAIIMHHHPAPVGTPLIDHYILKNNAAFWEIVTGTKVELIICGHVHGDYAFKYNNIMIESAPATCFQWEKGTTDLRIDPHIGYKIYYFDAHTYNSTSTIWK